MKKIIILLMALIIGTLVVKAEETYCCAVPENLSSPIARGITNCLGCNQIAKKAAKIAIIKVLKRNAEGDYKIKIDSFSAMDLKHGKFKSIEIEGQNINARGIYVSSVMLKTLCEYNHVDYTQNPPVFYTDVPMSFSAVITEDNLNRTLIDLGYIKQLMDLNVGGISFFKIDNVIFKLKSNKIYLIAQMKAPILMGERTVRFTFSGKLNVENGKIVLENLSSENLRNINMSKFVDVINSMNPFDIPLEIFKGNDTTLSVNNVRIIENKICVDGIIVAKRSCDEQTKEEK